MKSVLLCIGLCALLTPFNLLARGSSGASFDLQEEPACGNHNQVPCLSRDYSLPLKKVHPDDNPTFKDDLDFYGLQLAIDRQIIRYNNKNIKGDLNIGGERIPQRHVLKTLKAFKADVNKYLDCKSTRRPEGCLFQFQQTIQENYKVYEPDLNKEDPRYGEENSTFFTAYYTPLLDGKLSAEGDYQHAIYKKPQTESLWRSTRGQIDYDKVLANKGLELFYTKDLFNLYLLHVEGGGRVRVMENGVEKKYYISYAGTNKRSWKFISIYMRNQGWINDSSIESQRQFLKDNPDKQEEAYRTCPSYVYFKITETPPEGSDMVSLTDNRSIATDYRNYRFKGLLTFVKTQRLKESKINKPNKKIKQRHFKPFSRFMLDQDTGGAIKGKARVDLYFGEGKYARRAAELQSHYGQLFYLLLK